MHISPSSTAQFFRSVVRWLQVGYPDGVPGPDRIALLELLRSTPLTEDQIEDAVDAVDDEVQGEGAGDERERDVIADFIEDMSHYDVSPESIARVAAKLAAAGWPLAGIGAFVNGEGAPTNEEGAPKGEGSASQT